MSRSLVLVLLLLILIVTSQFEWKEQTVNEFEATPSVSNKQHLYSYRQEAVKEKILISQERDIQRLIELVRGLREQLQQCRGSNDTRKGVVKQLTENGNGHDKQKILED
ncbi:hypothetical protein IFM89_020536 [Coptis chinensis]|uniref:Uncharacterized protein n=1 Tax=Coptis chinensis TaxID=261450 RepID=A0A835LS96_9MAGN|nr:hypothetical protein IFM89_020536 [Coptis chinensis]